MTKELEAFLIACESSLTRPEFLRTETLHALYGEIQERQKNLTVATPIHLQESLEICAERCDKALAKRRSPRNNF